LRILQEIFANLKKQTARTLPKQLASWPPFCSARTRASNTDRDSANRGACTTGPGAAREQQGWGRPRPRRRAVTPLPGGRAEGSHPFGAGKRRHPTWPSAPKQRAARGPNAHPRPGAARMRPACSCCGAGQRLTKPCHAPPGGGLGRDERARAEEVAPSIIPREVYACGCPWRSLRCSASRGGLTRSLPGPRLRGRVSLRGAPPLRKPFWGHSMALPCLPTCNS